MRIGIVGGTGREGRGLAARWAAAGHRVLIGSRDAARALERARELSEPSAGLLITGGENAAIAMESEVVVLTVPYGAHGETLRALRVALEGKILVDLTVPLKPPSIHTVHVPPGESCALEAQTILGASCKVIATLHHVSSTDLADVDTPLARDVLVCGDDVPAKDTVMALVRELGARALDAGPLRNAIALEALTPVLLHLNKKYSSKHAGLSITGLSLA